ncbi:MAG: hypothetical protein ACP5E3_02715 [Bacteroidales bacterium]
MKKNLLPQIVFLFAAAIISVNTTAQEEKSEVQVKIIKDGKTIKDTTYLVEDKDATAAAVKMLDFTLGEKPTKHGKHVYTFKTEDGKSYEWKSEDSGDHKLEGHTYVFAEKGEDSEITIHMNEDGEKVVKKEVIVKKLDGESAEEIEEIIIVTEDKPGKIDLEGENIEWIEKDDHKILIIDDGENAKRVKVISGDNKNSNYNFTTEDGKRYTIKEVEKGDNKEIEVKVTTEDEKGEVKKEKKKKKK